MNRLKRSPLYGSVFALALSAVALLATVVVRPYLEPNVFVFFFLAAWASTWQYGRTAGLVSTATSAVAILYFFLRTDPTGPTPSWSILTRLIAFVVTGGLIIWMTAAWREGRRLFGATLSGIGDAVLVTDSDGRVTFLNPVAETLTGWPGVDAKGKPATELVKLLHDKTRE